MNRNQHTDAVTGKTIRFSWKDGPTKGQVHEHIFHEDGTVEWHDAGKNAPRESRDEGGAERVKFVDEPIAEGMRLVSYLSKSGYTLTVVLNSWTDRIAGVASNDNTWLPVHGTFEVVG